MFSFALFKIGSTCIGLVEKNILNNMLIIFVIVYKLKYEDAVRAVAR
jgi:uncharacterized ion transporter superfamily protein YfcC